MWEALADIGWTTDGSVGGGRSTPPSRSSPTCPCWSTRTARSCPSARTRSPSSPTGTRATCPRPSRNYLGLLGWSPPGDEEMFTRDQMVDVVPPGGRQPLPGLLRRGQAHPHERRVHPGPARRRVRRGRPPVGGPRRASGRRTSPAAVADEAASTPTSSRGWRRSSRSGCHAWARCPAMVDFLFLEDPAIDEASWDKAIGRRRGERRRILAAAIAAYRDVATWEPRCAPRGHPRRGRGGRPQARQGPGADPGGGDRPPRRAAAVRVAGRAGADRGPAGASNGRSPARRRTPPRPDAPGRPVRWALRLAGPWLVIAVAVYFGVTAGPGVADRPAVRARGRPGPSW